MNIALRQTLLIWLPIILIGILFGAVVYYAGAGIMSLLDVSVMGLPYWALLGTSIIAGMSTVVTIFWLMISVINIIP